METYKELFEQDKNQPKNNLIRATLSIFDFSDSDSEYLKDVTILKKVFWYLDKFINDNQNFFQNSRNGFPITMKRKQVMNLKDRYTDR